MIAVILIGENIHVISKEVRRAVDERDPEPIRRLARRQAEAGADYLDLNLGPLDRNPEDTARWVVDTVQETVDLPLCIDTPNPVAMRAALESCQKTPMINSACLTAESKQNMLPLAAEFSADVVLMTLSDEGLPGDADERAELTVDLVEYAAGLGIDYERMWIDGALMPAGVNQDQVTHYIEFVAMVPDLAPGAKTITGLSNVSSCGTPAGLRGILNRTLFIILERRGHTAVIADVLDQEMVKLNSGRFPDVRDLVYRAMDEQALESGSLSPEEAAYVRTVDVLMGRRIYSHTWLEQ